MKASRFSIAIAVSTLAVLLLAVPTAQAAPQGADVSLQMEASSAEVQEGEIVKFHIQVLNKGPATATDVTLTDQVPAAFSVTGATTTQGTCAGGQSVTCSLGSLGKQAMATVEITARAVQQGSHWNGASASASSPDQRTENNDDYISVAVTAPPAPPAPPLPARCSGVAPVNGEGCTASFSVSATTPVTLSFTDRPLSGILRAVVVGPSGLAGEIAAEFAGGQPTSGTTSRSLSLAAGQYQLWVTIQRTSVTGPISVTKPGLPPPPGSYTLPGCLFNLQPITSPVWCAYSFVYGALPPVVKQPSTIIVPGLSMPSAVGGFGAEVRAS